MPTSQLAKQWLKAYNASNSDCFDLGNAGLYDKNMTEVRDFLQEHDSISALDLSGNALTKKAVEILGTIKPLKKIILDNNVIGDEGVKCLLKNNPQLVYVSLRNTNLSKEILASLESQSSALVYEISNNFDSLPPLSNLETHLEKTCYLDSHLQYTLSKEPEFYSARAATEEEGTSNSANVNHLFFREAREASAVEASTERESTSLLLSIDFALLKKLFQRCAQGTKEEKIRFIKTLATTLNLELEDFRPIIDKTTQKHNL